MVYPRLFFSSTSLNLQKTPASLFFLISSGYRNAYQPKQLNVFYWEFFNLASIIHCSGLTNGGGLTYRVIFLAAKNSHQVAQWKVWVFCCRAEFCLPTLPGVASGSLSKIRAAALLNRSILPKDEYKGFSQIIPGS